mmetsp:Transcript_7354/g.9323  ORF Transcript_7354/g.9323 Transcript_7354/m.9323 type:complete len:552 (+) Transcript_7354:151-1806(+)
MAGKGTSPRKMSEKEKEQTDENNQASSKGVSSSGSGSGAVTVTVTAGVIALIAIGVSLIGFYGSDEWRTLPLKLLAGEHSRRFLSSLGVDTSVLDSNTEPGVNSASDQSAKPSKPFQFTVHFNGDGLSEGIKVNTMDFNGLDDLITKTCKELIVNDELITDESRCLPSNGAKLFTQTGIRCYSLLDIDPYSRTYIVPQGTLFVWPLGKVGDVIYPKCVKSPIPGKPMKMKQLSMSPRVFSVENFMTKEEIEKIIEHNAPVVKPSEVGFAGWRDDTRTSSTSWDFTSWAAKSIQKRAFDIVSMPYNPQLADAVQVLRYENTEWYKPHCDWFDAKGYDGHDPTVNNGTNRFVTVFLYISDVEEGGHTVFPLSTTHEGYNGEQLVHKGTEKTAGYIANKDAQWVCNTSSTALRSKPVAGNAVIFYSQGPRGELDPYSLHGGCPVIKGTKWSANVWIWNREKPDKSKAKDGKGKNAKKTPGAINVLMVNDKDSPINIYWDDGSHDMVFQMEIPVDQRMPMTTYEGHRFVAKNEAGEYVGEYRASPKDDDNEILFA